MVYSTFESASVQQVFDSYPQHVQPKMLKLRQLVLDAAMSFDEPIALEETLKWGEPSYLAKQGSTIRMDYKPKYPEQYALYFNCKTKLIDTFQEVYADDFIFEGNRAICFELDKVYPEDVLRSCIEVALTYHQRKNLPLLGL